MITFKYFPPRDGTVGITKKERLWAFFRLLMESTERQKDLKSAHRFLHNTINKVELDVYKYNGRFSSHPGIDRMEVDPFDEWIKLPEFEGAILTTETTHQVVFISCNGAFEIHQAATIAKKGLSRSKVTWKHYKKNKYKTRIIKFPGENLRDVWGRKLLLPKENYSSYKKPLKNKYSL